MIIVYETDTKYSHLQVLFNGVKQPKYRGYDLQLMVKNYIFKTGLRLRRIKDVKPH